MGWNRSGGGGGGGAEGWRVVAPSKRAPGYNFPLFLVYPADMPVLPRYGFNSVTALVLAVLHCYSASVNYVTLLQC